MKYLKQPLKCKICGSDRVIKFGAYHGIQRLWCKDCQHKFADNDAVSNMKTPAGQVSKAIELFFSGVPVNRIPRLIFEQFGTYVTRTAVFQWITHFGGYAIVRAGESRISVGDIWMLEETGLKSDSDFEDLHLIDVVDIKTRFLMATEIVNRQEIKDFQSLMDTSVKRAEKMPCNLLTDKFTFGQLRSLFSKSPENFGSEVTHIECFDQDGLIQNWKLITGSRRKIIRGLRKSERLRLVLDGWAVNYNYFCSQDELNSHTPAEEAGVAFNLHGWSDVICQPKMI